MEDRCLWLSTHLNALTICWMKKGCRIHHEYLEQFEEWDELKFCTKCLFLDLVSNVLKAKTILLAHYPQEMCFHSSNHVLTLFFSNLQALRPIQGSQFWFFYTATSNLTACIILHTCWLYDISRSNSNHAIYAIHHTCKLFQLIYPVLNKDILELWKGGFRTRQSIQCTQWQKRGWQRDM